MHRWCLVQVVVAATAVGAVEHVPPPLLPVPATVVVDEGLAYRSGPGADPERHRLDLYRPAGASAFPTLVFVHGGGYQRGDRSLGHNLGVVLAKRGVAVASISYRLFPAVRHPAQIEDVATAFAWVRGYLPAVAGDPQRVWVGGHSAGAHLASLLATDQRYLAAVGEALPSVAGVIALSGGYRINPIRREVFGGEQEMADASPFAHLQGGHPFFLLAYGSLEKPERHQLTEEFRAALAAVGTRVEVLAVPDREHQDLFDRIDDQDPVTTAILRVMERKF